MIKNLNNTELLLEIKNLIKEEKRITQLVLDYLQEVEHRKLYALRGYPSLFEFCVKELGYSESSAFRRISAMRLIKAIPEAKVKLEEGSVNLSTLSQLQSFIKKEERINGVKLNVEEKTDFLLKIENKSQSQCEREFVKLNPQIIEFRESKRVVTDNLTEIKFMASNELMSKLNELRNLLSHKDVQSTSRLIEELADLALKRLSPKTMGAAQMTKPMTSPKTKAQGEFDIEVEGERKREGNAESNSDLETELVLKSELEHKSEQKRGNSEVSAEYKFKNFVAKVHNDTSSLHQSLCHTSHHASRYIPQKIKNTVWQRDRGECQYIDPITKKKCLSKSYLEFDHVIPLAKGGDTSLKNLRLLCFAHNQIEAFRHFSRKHMEKFANSIQ